MKHLYQTLCNASNLKLLCGKDFGYEFPYKYPKDKDPKRAKIRTTVTLAKIIADTSQLRVDSFDTRFDKKHPIELAIEQLHVNGFTREVVYKIMKSKPSVNSKKIKGTYSFLSNFITDQYKNEIETKLKTITINRSGQFIRDGKVF